MTASTAPCATAPANSLAVRHSHVRAQTEHLAQPLSAEDCQAQSMPDAMPASARLSERKPQLIIVSPALAEANNGNWQTAHRWQQMLAGQYAVRIVQHWPDGAAAGQDVCMLALHARRSALSIAAWSQAVNSTSRHLRPANSGSAPGLAVVLTGTDLYRDIQTDAQAQQSLHLAQRLVVLQERAPEALPEAVRSKTTVIYQSCSGRHSVPKTTGHLRAVMVGHLRDEKSPETLFAAARLLSPQDRVLIDHIGLPLDPLLGAQAQATAAACPQYRWLGGQPHEATRKRIQRAHVLVHASRMEGGAHVLMEAVRAGTPVLASRIAGNIGMLGADYSGYFDWNNAEQLAQLLRRCRAGQVSGAHADPLYAHLHAQCSQRALLFAPEAEQTALLNLVHSLNTI